MSVRWQLFLAFLCPLLTISYVHGFLTEIVKYQLNKNAYKKAKKGQSFKEWLLFKRYRHIIPHRFLCFYFILSVVEIIAGLVVAALNIVKILPLISTSIVLLLVISDFVCYAVLRLFTWSSTPGEFYDFSRIIKKRGQRPSRKSEMTAKDKREYVFAIIVVLGGSIALLLLAINKWLV